jgi:two-component system, NtrC family, response regulator GlrR
MHNIPKKMGYDVVDEKPISFLRLASVFWGKTRMNAFNILLAESSERPCSDDRSHNLKAILETSALGSHLRVQNVCLDRLHTFPSEPDLVVLRFGPAPLLAWKTLIERLQGWKAAKLIGAFCCNTGSQEITQSLEWGLADYVLCPWREADMVPRLERLLPPCPRNKVIPDGSEARKSHFHADSLIGESPCFLRQLEQIPLLARTEATVLILGETGTGKEVFARAIHDESKRRHAGFIPVNCGALPDQLVENELFGHVKGAYTNAFASHRGLVAEAEGGTLFLDEVDALSAQAQTKLLRFLQDRQYRSLGSSKSVIADVRIIAATNANLGQRVASQQFREDLFYRLKVLSFSIPPLRERTEDIPILARYFLSTHGDSCGYEHNTLRLSPSAVEKLIAYHWPGNVRELEGTIQRAIFLAQGGIIGADSVELPFSPVRQFGDQERSLRQAKSTAIRDFERTYLANLLAQAQGNITHAAKLAGKDRRAIQRLLQKHHLDRTTFQSGSLPPTTF